MPHEAQSHATDVDGRDVPLAELADRQHGVVSSRQLLQLLGYTRSAITRAATAGRLHRLHRGVYAVGHTNLSRRGSCLAAVLASGSEALLSHHSAAWLWGIASSGPFPLAVTTPVRRRARSSIQVHYARGLTDEDREARESIPVTSLPRTLLDVSATLSLARTERILEGAERLGLFDLHAVESLLSRTPGHRGAAPLRRALSLYRDEPAFLRSELERRFLGLIRESGLPLPSMNAFVEGCELDAFWPRERFAVELDGYEHHRGRVAFERDRLRQEELKLAGVEVIRVTSRRVDTEPRQLIEHIGKFLEQRKREIARAHDDTG